MLTCSEYRRRARAQLQGNIFSETWLLALVSVLIYGAITSALSFTGIGTILVIGPLEFGLVRVLLPLCRGNEKIRLESMFDGFRSNLSTTILLGFLRYLFTALWALLFIIPGIIKSYSYSQAMYMSSDHPDWTWKQCLDTSIETMKGRKMKLFLLDLSFIGWYIVGALCFGVGALWVAAYHYTARANFYQAICDGTENG